MTERPQFDAKYVKSKKLAEGLWLVGWLFDTQKSGEGAVRALGDLYNAFDNAQPKPAGDGESHD